jgi:hypothetical protein
MKTIIHVNQHVIKKNRKTGAADPVLTCKTYKSNQYGSSVEVLGDSGEVIGAFMYRPENPLSCGAHVWFETSNEVRVIK